MRGTVDDSEITRRKDALDVYEGDCIVVAKRKRFVPNQTMHCNWYCCDLLVQIVMRVRTVNCKPH